MFVKITRWVEERLLLPRKTAYLAPPEKSYDCVQFENRMKTIKKIADRNMEKACPSGKFLPVRDSVVISYEDLLRIWDIADKALWETPVE